MELSDRKADKQFEIEPAKRNRITVPGFHTQEIESLAKRFRGIPPTLDPTEVRVVRAGA